MGVELFLLPVKIITTYLVLYYLLPRLYDKKRAFISLCLLLLALVIAAIINSVVLYGAIFPVVFKEATNWQQLSLGRIIWSFVDICSVVGLAMSFKYFRLRVESLEKEKKLIEEKLQSELRFLRSQTNPHFLFNVLNSVYALARKKDDRTEAAILQLSHLLRFMIYECNATHISLEKECQMIQNYLDLELLRFQDKLQLDFVQKIDRADYQIPPLLLLPLIENAIKHGTSENRHPGFINIHLQVEQGNLQFTVKNAVEDQKASETPHGLGLQNLRRQLALLFPNRHQLTITNDNHYFQVDLAINLIDL